MGNAELSDYYDATMAILRSDGGDFANRRAFVPATAPAVGASAASMVEFFRGPVFWVSPRGLVVIAAQIPVVPDHTQNLFGNALPAHFQSEVSFDTSVTLDKPWAGAEFGDWVALWRARAPAISDTLAGFHPLERRSYSNYSNKVAVMWPPLTSCAVRLWTWRPIKRCLFRWPGVSCARCRGNGSGYLVAAAAVIVAGAGA
jgi:hypothetical protein